MNMPGFILIGVMLTWTGGIGPRNVFRPDALHAAADYIRREWAAQNHEVMGVKNEKRGSQSYPQRLRHFANISCFLAAG